MNDFFNKMKEDKEKQKEVDNPTFEIPTHDPQTGELNPLYEELTGKKNPLKP